MSSPSSWPAPSGPPNHDKTGQDATRPVPAYGATQPVPQGYAPTQQVPVAQPYGGAPYGGGPAYAGAPVGYGGHLPVPALPPKPERPLGPGVWWSLLYNVLTTIAGVIALVALSALIISFFAGISGGEADWSDVVGASGTGEFVLVVSLIVLAGLLLSWGFTVLCLVLWRLVRGFRTLHPAVQALLALLTSWVVGWILSFVLQIVGAFAGVLGGGASTSSF